MIFSSTDKDTDWVRVYTAPEVSGLIIEASKRGSYLTRDTAIRLRDALDAWLAETGGYARLTPSAPPADHSLIDQLIRRAAAEAVTDQWSDVQIPSAPGSCRSAGCAAARGQTATASRATRATPSRATSATPSPRTTAG
jgi:hypothetical protein